MRLLNFFLSVTKRHTCQFCSWIFLILVPVISFAQPQNLKFLHFGIREGLSHSNVRGILQDRNGFMWFATHDGLNKYDGYNFTVYENDPSDSTSLSHNSLWRIIEDRNGNIWIATWGGGLNKFNTRTEQFLHYRHDKDDTNSIPGDFIYCILEDDNGDIWIGTNNAGVAVLDTETNTVTRYQFKEDDPASLSSNEIREIYRDRTNNIWVATGQGGLNLFDRKTKSFRRFMHDGEDSGSIGSNSIRAIYEDADGNLWLGTYGAGLDCFDRTKNAFTHFRHDPQVENSLAHNAIQDITGDDEGNIWIATENGGVSIFNRARNTFVNYQHDVIDRGSLNDNSVYVMFKDRNGNIWIGTFNGGVNLVSKDISFTHFRHTSSPYSLSNDLVLCIYEDSKNNLWVGTDGGGLDKLDRTTNRFQHYKHVPGNRNSICGNYVLSVCEDKAGNIWLGTWGDGVTVFNPEKNSYRHFKNDPSDPGSLSDNNVWQVFEDREGNIWIGTYGRGLNRYNPKQDNFTHFVSEDNDPESLSLNSIYFITEDSKGFLWVGTDGGGLNRLDKKTGKFKRYMHESGKNSLSHNRVISMHEDTRGDIWIATNQGLNHFDPKTERFTVYLKKDGFPGDAMLGILEDDAGNLWISTNKGISRFNPITKEIRNFTAADGLQPGDHSQGFLKSRTGAMYFGGKAGFSEFYPDKIVTTQQPYPLVITGFEIFNKPVSIASAGNFGLELQEPVTELSEVALSYKHSVFSFQFALLNYTNPEWKLYSYMLEGFDKEWNMVSPAHSATYTNLDPGVYTFKVKGVNSEGHLSQRTTEIKVIISPPYWKTWWFRLSLTLLLAGSLIAFYRIRIGRVRKQKEELERLVKQRTESLAKSTREERIAREEAERMREEAERANKAKTVFLATMSHEIRTPMNGVIGMASLLKETPLNAEQIEYANTISNCGDSLLSVINNVLDFSKIESGSMELDTHDLDLRTCIEDVLDIFAVKAAETQIDLVYQIDCDVPGTIVADGLRLRQVLINLIGNAIKFTRQGEVFLHVKARSQRDDGIEICFTIRDTGIGIPPDKIGKLFKAFSQVDSSTTRKYGGTGLGLAICEKLVRLMGGDIHVESDYGTGTTFVFTIAARPSSHAIMNYVHLNVDDLRGKKVLIIDDNKTNREVLKIQVALWKFVPLLAESADEVLQIMSREEVHLLITDMQMPGTNGIELARAVRESHSAVPIILLSSVGDENRKQHADLFASILTKPVKQKIFLNAITSALRNRHRANATEAVVRKLTTDFAQQYPLKILIAEDNPVNQTLAVRALKKLGYECDVAVNGRVVLEKMASEKIDVIFMDVQMPEMDGLESTRAIRKSGANQPVIIAMTANAMAGDREICIEAGMNDYISKPVRLEELISVLERWAQQPGGDTHNIANLQ